MRIAITRPNEYAEESVRICEEFGFEPLFVPMISVREKDDPAFETFIKRIKNGEVDFVIFTSVNGVRYTIKKIERKKEFFSYLNRTNVVAIGPKTERALRKIGVNVDVVPEGYSSRGVLDALSPIVIGKKVEIIRSTHGSPLLPQGLKDAGADVHEVHVYEIVKPENRVQRELIRKIVQGEVDIVTFTSTMTVKNFFSFAEEMGMEEEIRNKMKEMVVAAIGDPTARMLKEFGIDPDVVPENYLFKEMIRAIHEKTGGRE
ncbi:MAG: uroporphyrinogen-III synthase [Candidatus Syntropharchaeia archaeon]